MSRRRARRRSRLAAVAESLVALAVLVGLLVGVPLVLLELAEWPITGVPTMEQLRKLPETAVTDEALLAVLTVAAWLAWALFACSVAVETVAQARGRAAGVNIGGPLQRLAARLLGSLVLSLGTVGVPVVAPLQVGPGRPVATELAVSVSATAGQQDVVVARSVQGAPTQEAGPSQPAPPPPPSTAPGAPSVVVHAGDHFWGLAESALTQAWGRAPADHEMVGYWLDLVEANRQLLAPPHDPDLIYPEQVFNLPPPPPDPTRPAQPAPPPPPAPPAPAPTPSAPDDTLPDAPPDDVVPDQGEEAPPDQGEEAPPDQGEEAPESGDTVPEQGEEAPPDEGEEAPSDQSEDTLPDQGEEDAPGEPSGDHGPPVVDEDGMPTEDPENPGEPPPDTTGDEPGAETGDPDGGTTGDTTETTDTTDTTDTTGATQAGGSTDTSVDEPGAETGDPDGGTTDTSVDETEGGGGGSPPDSTGAGSRRPAPDTPGTSTAAGEGEDAGGGSFPLVLVGGGIALGGALLLLERRRRAQMRFRPAGQRIRMPQASLAETEQSFRQAADVDGAQLVDVALRAAAGRSEATGLPALRWVEATDDTVTLVLGAPVPPPPGFQWEGRDRWVSSAASNELAALAANMDVPAPALVPVGTTEAGAEVLVDLEASGVVEVSGRPPQTAALLRSLALATATSPWVDEARIWLVGIGGELADHHQVTVCATLSEALAEAEAQRDRVTEALRALRCQTTREARAVSANPSRWAPLVVVSAVPAGTPDEQQRLARLADRADCGVAVVLPATGDTPDAGVARFTLGRDGTLRVSGVEPALWPHVLDGGELEAVAELLDVAADRDAVEPDPDSEPRPPGQAEPRPETDEAASPSAGTLAAVARGSAARNPQDGLAGLMAEVDVVVRVLGEVEVVRRAGDTWDEIRRLEVSRPKVLEVISYLAMRDAAVEREDLEIALAPDGTGAPKTVYNLISVARKVLGDDLFPVSDGRRYRLSERVVTDYALFYELIAQADESGDREAKAELLAESLDLVMGEPFTGAGRGFAWVGPHRGVIVAQVIDAAEELAEIHLDSGNWRAAEWAARKGLRAFPTDERMYRILMRAASASGNVSGVHRVFRELLQVIADPDDGVGPEDNVHPETLALLEDLTGSQRPAS